MSAASSSAGELHPSIREGSLGKGGFTADVKQDFKQTANSNTPVVAAIHQVLHVHSDAITAMAISHEPACQLALGSRAGELVILPEMSTDGGLTLLGHGAAVVGVSFSVGNTYLASGSEDQTVRVWRVDSGNCAREFSMAQMLCAVAFHPINANLLLFGDEKQGLACVNVTTAARAAHHVEVGAVADAVFSHAGTVVFAATRGGSIAVLQLRAAPRWGLSLWRSFPIAGDPKAAAIEPAPHGLAYSPWVKEFSSAALLVPCMDRSVRLFAWQGIAGAGTESRRGGLAAWMERFHGDRGSDALSCRLVLRLPGSRRMPGPVAFFGEGASHTVCGSASGALCVVNLRTQRLAESLAAHSQRVSALCANASGFLLASGDASGCVIIWGAQSSQDAGRSAAALCGFSGPASGASSNYDSVAECA